MYYNYLVFFVYSLKVPARSLPYLPDCPVANLANSTFLGNVECVCSDVRCQSKIRIKPIAGTVSLTVLVAVFI